MPERQLGISPRVTVVYLDRSYFIPEDNIALAHSYVRDVPTFNAETTTAACRAHSENGSKVNVCPNPVAELRECIEVVLV